MSEHYYGVAQAGAGRLGHLWWAAYGSPENRPVVLLHGLADSGACWPGTVEHLAERYLVIVPDARGHGDSQLLPGPFRIRDLADDVATIVRKVAQRPAALVGHSMGGVVAQDFALRAPALVSALVLEDPAWTAMSDGEGRLPADLTGWLRDLDAAPFVQLLSQVRDENPGWADDEMAPWAHAKKAVDPQLAELPHVWRERDWVESLGDLAPDGEFRTTVLAGDPGRGSVVTMADGARAAQLLGDAGHVHRLDAGHSVRRDQREAFLAILDQALADIKDPPIPT